MRGVTITLGLGLALLAVAIGLTLARSPMSVARSTGGPGEGVAPIAVAEQSTIYCQEHEAVPRGTSAIRLAMFASIGPRVRVVVLSGERTISSGEQASAWTGRTVTVALTPVARPLADATICASVKLGNEGVTLLGERTSSANAAREAGVATAGRVRIEYLRPGSRSWASLIPSVIRHMALGRATKGTWIVFVALALALAVAVLASRLILKDLT